MKKLIILLVLLMGCRIFAYSQISTEKAVDILEYTFKNSESAWSEFKLVKHDKVDTLYILPTESEEYIKADLIFEKMKANPQDDANANFQILNNLGNAVINYTDRQKGWKMRCRVLYNGEEQNIEVHYDINMQKITDILLSQYALLYAKMRSVDTPKNFWIMKKQFDNRKSILN